MPRKPAEARVSTAVRLPQDLLDKAHAAASERDVSVNRLIERALRDYIERLVPVEEVKWTR